MILQQLRWKNFQSYGNNTTTFNLNNSQTIGIIGKNGSGKSSILSALYFVITGKPYQDVNKGTLVNSLNKKNCMVELDFCHNNSSYTIKRGIKPNVFEIFKDGELVDQSSYMKDYQNILEECLGLTPATIKQTIILSSRFYTPFLELSASEKREFIETLLGIKIFANMQDLLKVEVSSLKQEEQFIQKDIDKVSSNIKLTKEYIQTNEEQTKINNDEVLKEISLLQVLVESVNKEIEEATSSLSQLQLEYDKYKEAPALKDKFLKLLWHNRSKIEVLLDKNNKLDTNICDNCGQTIDLQYKKKTVDNNNLQLEELEKNAEAILAKLDRVEKGLSIQSEYADKITATNRLIFGYNNELSSLTGKISTLQKTITNKVNNTSDLLLRLNDLNKESSTYKDKLFSVTQDKEVTTSLQKLIGDKGIKRFIIGKYIPVLNQFINQYLEILDAKYSIEFDEELNEKIKARGYEDLGFGNFSSGERDRCNLAMLFAFLELSKLKNNVSCNVLFFDEMTVSLDSEGKKGLLNLCNMMNKNGISVYIITHDQDIVSELDNKVIVMKNKYSEIKYG